MRLWILIFAVFAPQRSRVTQVIKHICENRKEKEKNYVCDFFFLREKRREGEIDVIHSTLLHAGSKDTAMDAEVPNIKCLYIYYITWLKENRQLQVRKERKSATQHQQLNQNRAFLMATTIACADVGTRRVHKSPVRLAVLLH